jgi:hypothetical protein
MIIELLLPLQDVSSSTIALLFGARTLIFYLSHELDFIAIFPSVV